MTVVFFLSFVPFFKIISLMSINVKSICKWERKADGELQHATNENYYKYNTESLLIKSQNYQKNRK